jgi:hypothetical protein
VAVLGGAGGVNVVAASTELPCFEAHNSTSFLSTTKPPSRLDIILRHTTPNESLEIRSISDGEGLIVSSLYSTRHRHLFSLHCILVWTHLDIEVIMSVRVVARIRPTLGQKELEKDTIVYAEASEEGKPCDIVRIPNPKNESEMFSFRFNGVYDQATTQEELFTQEGTIRKYSSSQGGLVLMSNSCPSH